jgi:hypothetical protein
MPVFKEPILISMKSTTAPLSKTLSMRLPNPPPTISDKAIVVIFPCGFAKRYNVAATKNTLTSRTNNTNR